MKLINTGVTLNIQVEKVTEEVEEFKQAIENKDNENLIEEFYDTIQAMLGVVKILGLEGKLSDGLKKHNEKLISRGWTLEDL